MCKGLGGRKRVGPRRAHQRYSPRTSTLALALPYASQWLPKATFDMRALLQAHPDIVVVPAHDSTVQDQLGYFPNWVR